MTRAIKIRTKPGALRRPLGTRKERRRKARELARAIARMKSTRR